MNYWVLELHKNISRLYHFDGTQLTEVETPLKDKLGNPVQGFPLDVPAVEERFQEATGTGDRDASYKDHHQVAYFDLIDRELGKKLHEEKLPVIVIGVERNVAFFKHHTKHAREIMGYESHASYLNKLDIMEAARRVIHTQSAQKATQILHKFIESDLKHRVFGMDRVEIAAREGRIDTLLIEEGVVAMELLKLTCETRGKVVLVPKDALKDFEHVAALLRY